MARLCRDALMEGSLMNTLTYQRLQTPFGDLLVVASGDALTGVYFDRQKYFPAIGADWREDDRSPLLRAACAQLDDYFAGALAEFDLPLAPAGTPFQRGVWAAIATVPIGETISYGTLAARAGAAGSARAAGAATGRNPLSIIVPCHRIVGTNGDLTGYAGGLERKRALLDFERARRAPSQRAA